MQTPRRLSPLAILAALSLTTASHAQAKSHRAEGKFFVVIAHGLDQEAADQALEVVDPAWKQCAKSAGYRTPKAPKKKPEVHLYGTIDLYVEADQKNTGGQFARNLACALYDGTAHVALQPPVNAEFRKTFGLPIQTRRLLAHESTHLTRYQSFPTFRNHPRWFADALAFTVSHAVLESQGLARAMDEEPTFAADLRRVRNLASSNLLTPVATILERATETPDSKVRGRSFYELYAQHQVLGSFLQTDRKGKAWKKACSELRRLGGGTSASEIDRALQRSLKIDAKSEQRWQAHAAALQPKWNERSRSLVTTGANSWRQVAYPDTDARCFRDGSIGVGKHRVEFELEFLPAQNQEAWLLLGATTQTDVELIVRGSGGLQFVVQKADGSTHPFGSADLKVSGRVALAVAWDTETGELSVFSGDEEVCTATTDHPLTGAWGLAVSGGSAVAWHRAELVD